MSEPRWRRALPGLLTAAVLLIFALDLPVWMALSDAWPHTDSLIHFERMRLFAEAMRGVLPGSEVGTLVGYGPLPYLAAGLAMILAGEASVEAATAAMMVYALLGGLGTALVAARLGGRWAAPVAAALLLGLPLWRTHTLDLMVDMPGAAMGALALGLLLWSEGLERRWLAAGAALATGLALLTRWPVAFLLAPCWGLALLQLGWRATRRPDRLLLGLLPTLGAVGLGLLPVALWADGAPDLPLEPLALAPLAAGAWLLLWPPPAARSWWARALGVGLLIAATLLPATLWAPDGLASGLGAQVQMEQTAAMATDPITTRAWRALWVCVRWWTGPALAAAALLGLLLAGWRRGAALRWEAWALLALPACLNVLAVLVVVGEPDERHALASLPPVVAFAAALPGLLPRGGRLGAWPGALLAAALAGIGMLGVLAWRQPALPGVVPPEPWHRDINLVRDPARIQGFEGGAPWASLQPYRAGPLRRLAEALHESTGGRTGCLTWLISLDARQDIYLQTLVSHSRANLMQLGSDLRLEEHLDRPGSLVSEYDGAVVIDEPGSDLLERARCALPHAEALLSTEYEGHRVTALLVRDDDPPRGCGERFPGVDILPLGSGRDRAAGRYPGLPTWEEGRCGPPEPQVSGEPGPRRGEAAHPGPPDPARPTPPPPR